MQKGKCLYCEFKTLEDLTPRIGCTNPDCSLELRRTFHAAGEYPESFLPNALDGECTNWKLKQRS